MNNIKSIGICLLSASISMACGRAVVEKQPLIDGKGDVAVEQNLLEVEHVELDHTHHGPELMVQQAPKVLTEKKEAVAASIATRTHSRVMKSKGAQALEFYSILPAMDSMGSGYYMPPQPIRIASEPVDRENYARIQDNAIKLVNNDPVSTFSIDVDTGAYANVRRFLKQGRLPNQDAVRAEELINYFSYNYDNPESLDQPFSVSTEMAPTPWNQNTKLLHVGIKGYEKTIEELPASNLVFLIDVSGSMNSPDKLGLLTSSLKMLSRQMRSEDRVAIAVYAGAAGLVLEPTPGNQTAKISTALDQLSAGGSTNGGAGIRLAYNLAEQSFIKGGVNRVLLATDGDFNVGTTNFEALKQLVEEKCKTGIALTTLGFGTGNYNDHLMEQVADAGNGNYSYIDTLSEARKMLVEEAGATLLTIAKDVKIQIEFNPDFVSEYRLVGYENRMLKREDFNNDKVDAGEIGAGHTVTALYEITLKESGGQRIDPLRYGKAKTSRKVESNELAFLRLRYKQPDERVSRLIEQPLYVRDIKNSLSKTSADYRFSAAVAAFSQLLRGGQYTKQFDYADVLELARGARAGDKFGYRGEFVQLVGLADSLSEKPLS